ncbi:hypothetical protein QC764_505675 [Podospora pseudoanserina]|uniref:Uncharacterized protein n=1 Tax=Podospora pseudoanserina TaxID=2609844 RepID=A0ABR0I5V7_9PEZI|nr:hypothetical protein QC764_505675 [Podospora pseudoanserina]
MDGRAQRRVIVRPYVGSVVYLRWRSGGSSVLCLDVTVPLQTVGIVKKEAMVKLHAGFSILHRRLFGFQKKRRTAGAIQGGTGSPAATRRFEANPDGFKRVQIGIPTSLAALQKGKAAQTTSFLGPLNKSTETGQTDPEIHGRVLGLPCRGEPLWSTLQDVINTSSPSSSSSPSSAPASSVSSSSSVFPARRERLEIPTCPPFPPQSRKRGNSVAHPVAREISLFPSSLSLSLFWRSLLVCLLSKLLHRPATIQAEIQQRQDL